MKIAAIICEYNPFHNGHKYQLEQVKSEYDAVIAIMSGSFVQRGELAIFDKWTRAKTALLNGVDLVIELPVCYALNTAERFAYGAVRIADATGVCDALCFGSESGNIDELLSAAELLNNEPAEISFKIQSLMNNGVSFPAAREKAYLGEISGDLLSEPNNILAIEYIKALKRLNSNIKPTTVKRIGARYNETDHIGTYNSASGIRELLKQGEDVAGFLPENTTEILKNAPQYRTENLFSAMKYAIISAEEEFLANINDIREGLEHRIVAAAKGSGNYNEMLDTIKTKRYTMSCIKRILLSVLLKLDKETASAAPEYLRILGMNELGKNILKEMKQKSALPIISKTADFSARQLECDILATDIASIASGEELGKDYKRSPIVI